MGSDKSCPLLGIELGFTKEMLALRKELTGKGYEFIDKDSSVIFAKTTLDDQRNVSKGFFATLHYKRTDNIVIEINYQSEDLTSNSVVKMQEWYKETLRHELKIAA